MTDADLAGGAVGGDLTLGERALSVHQTHEAHRAIDVGSAGIRAAPRDTNPTREAVAVDRAEGGLDASRVGTHLVAGAAVVVHAAGVREYAAAQTANLARAAGLVIRAAILARARLANPGAETLVVVRADRRLAADPSDTGDGRRAVRVGLTTRTLESAPTVVAAAAAGTAVPIRDTRILTDRGFADAAVETVRVGLARDGLLTLTEEAVLIARAVGVVHTPTRSRDALSIDAGLADRALGVRVAAAVAAGPRDAPATRKALGVETALAALAHPIDAALAQVAVAVRDTRVHDTRAVHAVLTGVAIEGARAHLDDLDLADALVAELTGGAVGVPDTTGRDASTCVALQPRAAVAVHLARRICAQPALAGPITEAVLVGRAEGSLEASTAGADLRTGAIIVVGTHRRRIAATRLAHLVGAALVVVAARVLAGVDDADAVAEAVQVAPANRALDAAAGVGVAELRALAVGVELAAHARHTESGDALVARAIVRAEARVHAQAHVAQTVAQAVLAAPADRRLIAATIAPAELGAVAVVVVLALGLNDRKLAPPGVAHLASAAVVVAHTGPAAHTTVAHSPLVAVAVGLAEGPFDAAVLNAGAGAFAVHVRIAGRPLSGHTSLGAAHLARWALQVLGAPRVAGVDDTRAVGADLARGAIVRAARGDTRAVATDTLAQTIEVGATDLRLGADPLAGVADLRPRAVRIGEARARRERNARRRLAGPVGAALSGAHARDLAASERRCALQVAPTRIGGGRIAPIGARAGLADAPLRVETRGIVAARRGLGARAGVADQRTGAGRRVVAGRALHAGLVRAELPRGALVIVLAALGCAARAAPLAAGAARTVVVRRARLRALEVLAVAFTQAVVVGRACGGLGTLGRDEVTRLGALALVVGAAVPEDPRPALGGDADLVVGALGARRTQLPRTRIIGVRATVRAAAAEPQQRRQKAPDSPEASPHHSLQCAQS